MMWSGQCKNLYNESSYITGNTTVPEQQNSLQKKASFFYTVKSVMWAMLGVRRAKGYDEDVSKISAKQAIVVGLFAVFIFIMTLYFVVSFVIGSTAN